MSAPPTTTPTHIGELVADARNRRKHTPRNIGLITDALHKVGAARSIVIDEANEILAGNGVVEAAADAGITKVKVVDADGETIVAVRRRGLTAAQKRDLAIFDNRTAELAEWDLEQLRADREAGEDLSAFFYDDELAALLASDQDPATAAIGTTEASRSLIDRFGVPPFSVLDARQGYWQTRKRAWLALGIQSELGRGEALTLSSEETRDIGYYRKKRQLEAAAGRTLSKDETSAAREAEGTRAATFQGKRTRKADAIPGRSAGGSAMPLDRMKAAKRKAALRTAMDDGTAA
jgi:hypothetical protein